jgi:hypothetical protein
VLVLLVLCLFVVWPLLVPWGLFEGEFPPRAPYEAVRFEDEHLIALLAGKEFDLLEIDGIPVPDLVAFCRGTYGSNWQMRLREDLVEVLCRFGKPAFFEVDLRGIDLSTGAVCELKQVAMTEEKRRKAYTAARSAGERFVLPVPAPGPRRTPGGAD